MDDRPMSIVRERRYKKVMDRIERDLMSGVYSGSMDYIPFLVELEREQAELFINEYLGIVDKWDGRNLSVQNKFANTTTPAASSVTSPITISSMRTVSLKAIRVVLTTGTTCLQRVLYAIVKYIRG